MEKEKSKYILLKDLETYQLAKKLSEIGWSIYEKLDWQDKKVMGDQFIRSTDSIGANVAEGYGRFHYLDRIKFYYNSRASYTEAKEHWLQLLFERNKISADIFDAYSTTGTKFLLKLNNFISVTYKNKYEPKSESNFN